MWIRKDQDLINKKERYKDSAWFILGFFSVFVFLILFKKELLKKFLLIATISIFYKVLIIGFLVIFACGIGLLSVKIMKKGKSTDYACLDCDETFNYVNGNCPECKSQNIDSLDFLEWKE